jgi:aminoglycoside/choline kinase family phosphotransferase
MKAEAPSRALEIAAFLASSGWEGAEVFPFEADFSSRRYARLVRGDTGERLRGAQSETDIISRAVLMDADPSQHTPEFILIDQTLRALGLSAPDIFAADPDQGLVLMEDFGGRNVGNLFDMGEDAKPLYRRAVDVLIHLHKNFDPASARDLDIPLFGGALFASQAELFIDAYLAHVKNREATRDEGEGFRAAWKTVLKGIEGLPQSLLLRDFMPDNLMDLPGKKGVASLGLLDFQDAGLGPIAYDIASLCEIVRRDGGDKLFDEMIGYYHAQAKPKLALDDLTIACRILSAQRHMRILGVIAKLAHQTGRKEKLAYMPRIRNWLANLLKNEELRPVQQWVQQAKVLAD